LTYTFQYLKNEALARYLEVTETRIEVYEFPYPNQILVITKCSHQDQQNCAIFT
jgi:hypothetical protein